MLLKPIVKSSLIALAAGLAGLLVFYRCFFLSGFDLMPGDGDTKFNLVILEHWFRVAQGLEGWRSPNFFFPKEETLGYSDGLVLLAPPYIAARFAGLLPFHALQAMAMVWSLVGYAESHSNVAQLSMWSVARDNGNSAGAHYASSDSSGISQTPFQFSSIFSGFDHIA